MVRKTRACNAETEQRDNLRCGQIDADASCSGREKEQKGVGLSVEAIHCFLATFTRRSSIEPLHWKFFHHAILVQQVQHFDHLAEDENLVSLASQFRQEFIDEHHLPT